MPYLSFRVLPEFSEPTDRFVLQDRAGAGGMGDVFRAVDEETGREVAVKVLRASAGEPERRRFQREIAVIADLRHPNIVEYIAHGTLPDHRLFYAMEWLDGEDLGQRQRHTPLGMRDAVEVIRRSAAAMAAVHARGIVHRDLKLGNIFLIRGKGTAIKLIDFGVVKLPDQELADDRGSIIGTPHFMAPEQARGETVDPRADVYSLGALMYAVLTGKPPFTARSAVGVLTKHLTAEVIAPSVASPEAGLTEEIDAIILRAMEKEPDARWQTVAEMSAAIEAVYHEQVGDRSPVSLPRARSKSGRRGTEGDDEPLSELRLRREDLDAFERGLKRRRWVLLASTAFVIAAVLAAAGWWIFLRPVPAHTAEVEPNDDDAHATRIAPGTDVTGYLGRRISRSEPDRDIYEIDWPNGSQHIVTVRVSGLPNIDVALVIRDGRGRQVATADETGVGNGEALLRWDVDGALFVEVDEAMHDQKLAIENVSDPYTLSVAIDADDPGWEVEPNGNAPDATPVSPGSAVRGWLEARGEVDELRWDGPSGPVNVEVTTDGALPLRWTAPDNVARAPGTATLTLQHGDVIRLQRNDLTMDHDKPLPGIDSAWSVTVTPVQ